MFQIGEFSNIGQVSTRMLRHYDKINLLKPDYVDEDSGYRYYRPTQLTDLHKIIALKELGISLSEIAEIMSTDNFDLVKMRDLLNNKRSSIAGEIAVQQMILINIDSRLSQIEENGEPPFEIILKKAETLYVASIHKIVPKVQDMNEYCPMMYNELYTKLKQNNIKDFGKEITLYYSEEFTEENIEMRASVELSSNVNKQNYGNLELIEIPSEKSIASLIYRGPYAGLHHPILSLLSWTAIKGYHIHSPMRELHLSGKAHDREGNANDDAIIEIQVPVVKCD